MVAAGECFVDYVLPCSAVGSKDEDTHYDGEMKGGCRCEVEWG